MTHDEIYSKRTNAKRKYPCSTNPAVMLDRHRELDALIAELTEERLAIRSHLRIAAADWLDARSDKSRHESIVVPSARHPDLVYELRKKGGFEVYIKEKPQMRYEPPTYRNGTS